MSYKTTKKDFEVFKAECRKWVGYFGLLDWEICFTHETEMECRAACYPDYQGRIAIITLNTNWTMAPEDNEFELIAFHEACELLIAPLSLVALERHVTKDEITSATHGIIRTLENTVFGGKDA